MRQGAFTLALLLVSTSAFAQFGGLDRVLDKAQKVKKLADVKISEREEREIGQQVSAQVIQTFGIYQDAAVAKYVTLVGTVLAQASPRPNLGWEFIVLDTDGVNAFAAPGGFIHVTRGLLGLLENEAELAGVLAHEIVHVTEQHTVKSIQKANAVGFASNELSASGGLTQSVLTRIAEQAYERILNNEFDRKDEDESDERGVQLANSVGYAPTGLSSALTRLAERNKDRKEPSGLFASHPQIKDRLARIARVIKEKTLTATATVAARYQATVKLDARPIDDLAVLAPGTRGLAGGDGKTDDKTASKDAAAKPAKGGGLLGRLKLTEGKQSENTQQVASAGARGVNPDRDAVGGPNRNKVTLTIGPNEVAEFRKGIG